MTVFRDLCPVCGNKSFLYTKVLWSDLINAWQLADHEVNYINRQQGYHCSECKNNLRSMALASALMNEYSFEGPLTAFCKPTRLLSVLEINSAGNLTEVLRKLLNHKLIEYPDYDMENLDIPSSSFDLVIHSDTLEHIPNPTRGLSECGRVLKTKGRCIFTVPIIVERLTRSRQGLVFSYHGQAGVNETSQIVQTEFGVDIWITVMKAGFRSCEIFFYEYPAAMVIIAKK